MMRYRIKVPCTDYIKKKYKKTKFEKREKQRETDSGRKSECKKSTYSTYLAFLKAIYQWLWFKQRLLLLFYPISSLLFELFCLSALTAVWIHCIELG